jgi:hypothetical protein
MDLDVKIYEDITKYLISHSLPELKNIARHYNDQLKQKIKLTNRKKMELVNDIIDSLNFLQMGQDKVAPPKPKPAKQKPLPRTLEAKERRLNELIDIVAQKRINKQDSSKERDEYRRIRESMQEQE